MRTAFIASEYNPFHNGHKYLIDKVKEAGFDAVVAVMSGNFVQRGEPACADKFTRAEAAILGGADLVIELPMKYAVSTASYFAKGFIDTVISTGLENVAIAFGSSSDREELTKIKNIIYSDECQTYAEEKIESGVSFPSAKYQFIQSFYPDVNCEILLDPNNILALEYLNAIDNYGAPIGFFCTKRVGASHDSEETESEFSSAGYIRRRLFNNYPLSEVKGFMPENVYSHYRISEQKNLLIKDFNNFNIAAFSRLIEFDADYFKKINNVTGGIENRIVDAIRNTGCFSDLYDKIKSRHYTHSRVRQIVLSAVLGIEKKDLDRGVSYIRILAFNDKGREVLHMMKASAKIPVISVFSQINNMNDESIIRDANLDFKAAKFYSLCNSCQNSANPEFNSRPVYIKSSSI